MRPYHRVWRLGSLICILTLTSLIIHVPLIKPVDATQGTWVIESESVIIENVDLLHEGDIIIRGNGRLSMLNSTLTIMQLISWQFQIYVEDSGMLLINDSDIQSKYPFKIVCDDASETNFTSSSSSNAEFQMSGSSLGGLIDTTFFGIAANEHAQTTIQSCSLRSATSNGDSSLIFVDSVIGSIGIKGDSQTNISSSNVGPVIVESTKTTSIIDSEASALRGWGHSKIVVSGCSLGDYRYSDYVEASISNSTIGELDATGDSPLTLNQIAIGSAILRGSANVSMNECTVGTLEAYLNTAITMWNSTCEDFFSTQYAYVRILGTSSARSYFGNCIITQMCTAAITWSNFDYLEISHSSTVQVNDSYAELFYTWRYTTCLVDIWRCRFHNLGIGSEVSMYDSSVEIGTSIDGEVHFFAESCDFGADVIFYGPSAGYFENCTMSLLRPQYESQVVIRNCTAQVGVFDYANRVRTIDSVPGGSISYWSSYESNSFLNAQWNLTIYDSILTGWFLRLFHEAEYTISNSTIRRIEVKAQCSVLIEDSSIEELWSVDGETEVFRSAFTSIEIQTTAHLTLNQCVCDSIWQYNDAISTYINSTSDTINFYDQAESHLYNCVIRSIGLVGYSHAYFENCTMRNLDSFSYATAEIVNSTVEDRLATHDFTFTSITNSTVLLLSGYYSSQMDVSTSRISEIRLYHSSEVALSNSDLVSIYCIDTSRLSIVGNLSGTTSWSIQNSAQVIREFHFIVEDQLAIPIQSATVDVFDSNGNPVITGTSNSQGHCHLSVIFEGAGLDFLSAFTVVAAYSGYNKTYEFMTTSLQPIIIVIDLSSPFAKSSSESSIGWLSDTITKPILDEGKTVCQINFQGYDLAIYTLCFLSVSLFITLETFGCSIQSLKVIKKRYFIQVVTWTLLTSKLHHNSKEHKDVKI